MLNNVKSVVELEDLFPHDVCTPEVWRRPKLGQWVSFTHTVKKVRFLPPGMQDMVIYWEPKRLPELMRGVYIGTRTLRNGVLRPEEITKVEQYGICSVAYVAYHTQKRPMYVYWDSMSTIGEER